MNRAGRLQAARRWLACYDGKKLLRSYARHFAVDLACALKELQMLCVTFDPDYVKALETTLAARRHAAQRPADDAFADDEPWQPGDELFAFIAGRTEGGAAYGVTWEEMAAVEQQAETDAEDLPMAATEDDDWEELWDARLAEPPQVAGPDLGRDSVPLDA
jgi:hypothetical protein